MFKVSSSKNLAFIQQYVSPEVTFHLEEMKELSSYQLFIDAVRQYDFKSVEIFKELDAKYISKLAFNEILDNEGFEFSSDGITVLPTTVVEAFDLWMLDVGKSLTGYHVAENGRIRFNHKAFSEVVMSFYTLVVDRKDPETVLVYNNHKGWWEEAAQPLHRLVIEIAHATGFNLEDSWTVHVEKAVLDILRRKVRFVQSRNFNKEYFPLGNYSLDSNTGKLVPHSSSHLATFGSTITYEPNADCPIFKQFLEDLFEDRQTIDFVQEWFGYVLSNSHKANAFLIGIGSGANGKSTLFDTLAQLVGVQNVASAPLSNFNSEFGLEPLIDRKLNLATESDVDAFKTGKLKALTAGEDISVNRKNKQEVTITLPTKLVFLMNELPLLNDESFGYERRLLILPFDKAFLPHEQDKDLPKKLSKELEGILVWALEGLRRLLENDYNFTVSVAMKEQKEKYFGIGNPVANFIVECIESKPAHVMESNELINAYKIWMINQELPFKGTDTPQKFWKVFKEAMDVELIEYTRGKSNGRTVVRDIALK